MKQYQKIYVLYLEVRLLLSGSVVQKDLCEFSGIGRQQASKYFQIWQSISNVPFYHKNKKCWIKAKYSKSKLFRTKKEAQIYIEHFEFLNNVVQKKLAKVL